MHTPSPSPVSFMAQVTRLPEKGMPVTIEADEAQRQALAADHELLAVTSWRADLLVERWRSNGVKVSGVVKAEIVQQCVVSLDELPATISEDVSAIFLPEDSKLGRQGFAGGGEILIDPEGPDSPETFTGNSIDVGALAEQFFALAIDPYPRKPGVEIAAPDGDDDGDGAPGPLAEQLRSLSRRS